MPYAASHGGDGTQRRDRQSVFIHLMAICAITERSMGMADRVALLQKVTVGHLDFPRLNRPPHHPARAFTDLLDADNIDDYDRLAREWADAVWTFWTPEQPRIRSALDGVT